MLAISLGRVDLVRIINFSLPGKREILSDDLEVSILRRHPLFTSLFLHSFHRCRSNSLVEGISTETCGLPVAFQGCESVLSCYTEQLRCAFFHSQLRLSFSIFLQIVFRNRYIRKKRVETLGIFMNFLVISNVVFKKMPLKGYHYIDNLLLL